MRPLVLLLLLSACAGPPQPSRTPAHLAVSQQMASCLIGPRRPAQIDCLLRDIGDAPADTPEARGDLLEAAFIAHHLSDPRAQGLFERVIDGDAHSREALSARYARCFTQAHDDHRVARCYLRESDPWPNDDEALSVHLVGCQTLIKLEQVHHARSCLLRLATDYPEDPRTRHVKKVLGRLNRVLEAERLRVIEHQQLNPPDPPPRPRFLDASLTLEETRTTTPRAPSTAHDTL